MPFHQIQQTRAIFIGHCREFQSQPTTRFYMPYNGVRPDLPFLDQKIELGLCTNDNWLSRLEKQTALAQILNSRSIRKSSTTPVDPDPLRCLDSYRAPSRRSSSILQDIIIGAHNRPLKIRLGSLCGAAPTLRKRPIRWPASTSRREEKTEQRRWPRFK